MDQIESLEGRRLFHAEFAAAVDFAPLSAPKAPGMYKDYGSVYGVRRGGLTYGWASDASGDAVVRGLTKVRRNDAFIAMGNNTWSIAVENGTYSVYVVTGDPGTFNDRMAIDVNGQITVSGVTKHSRQYLDGQVTVDVTNGKITLSGESYATANKLMYLAISSVEEVPSYIDVAASAATAIESTGSKGSFTLTRGSDDDDVLNTSVTIPITIGGTATNGVDYGQIGSAVTLAAGVTSITIPVRPINDGITEGDETVTLTVGSVKGYTISDPSATVTIKDSPTVTPTKLTWTTAASRPVAASEIWGAAVDGKVYTFGGFTDTTYKPSKSLYIYNSATNTWSQGASLSVGLTHPGIATDDEDFIYFAGGYPGNGSNGNQTFSTTAVMRYNIDSNTYTTLPSLPIARGAGALTLLNNVLYFVGGDDSSRNDVKNMWALDLGNLNAGWIAKADAPASRNHAAFITLNGSAYLIAGQTGQDAALTTHADMYRYNVSTNTWTTLASMPGARSHVSDATFIYNNKIVVLGGQSAYNAPISSDLEYDPDSNTWSTITSLPAPRFSGVGGLIASNKFFYTAGYNTGFVNTTYIGTWS